MDCFIKIAPALGTYFGFWLAIKQLRANQTSRSTSRAKREVVGHLEILTQGFGSRQLLQEKTIAVAGFSEKKLYEKIVRKLMLRKEK